MWEFIEKVQKHFMQATNEAAEAAGVLFGYAFALVFFGMTIYLLWTYVVSFYSWLLRFF